jgi:hypothetical protein
MSDLHLLRARWGALWLVAAGALAALALLAGPAPIEGAGAATGGFASPSSPRAEPEEDSAVSQGRYERIWHRLSTDERRWANRTAECESGRNPRAIGGGGLYRGAFQFMKSTWRASPKSPGGDPIRFSYRTQAVVAVMLKRRDGAGHWPNCG